MTPPVVFVPLPPTQIFLQSLEVALRALFSFAKFVSHVVVLTAPAALTTATTRGCSFSLDFVSETFSVAGGATLAL